MKVMISQPMRGKTQEQIYDARCSAVKYLDSIGYEVANSLFEFNAHWLDSLGIVHVPLFYLAKAFETMSKCDAVYFCKGWADTRGCRLEHRAAKLYGLKVIYEENTKEEK